MFAPLANRTRALFTLTIRDDGRVDFWYGTEAFQTFYSLEPADVDRQLGPAGPTTLQTTEISALVDRLEELLVDAEAVSDDQEPTARWNSRDFYVIIGDRSWEDAERYGFVSAGGGLFWTKPLEKLFVGARIFLYKPYPVQGYVGVGVVKEKARPVGEFEVEVDGQTMPLLEAPLADPETIGHDADNPSLREHLVRVAWIKTRPLDVPVWQSGLFTNQMRSASCETARRSSTSSRRSASQLTRKLVHWPPSRSRRRRIPPAAPMPNSVLAHRTLLRFSPVDKAGVGGSAK